MISRLTTREYLPGVLIINIAKPQSDAPPTDSASESNAHPLVAENAKGLSSHQSGTDSANLIARW
jgi:hypothetical protein